MPPIRRHRRRGSAVYGGVSIPLPRASTLPASAVTATSAYLNGSVNPEGSDTQVWFAWGTTPQFGSNTPPVDVGAGTAPVTVGVNIGGTISPLPASQSYFFAVVAQSGAGTVYGSDLGFVTLSVAAAATGGAFFRDDVATASVDIPHFAYPMVIGPDGARVVEQNTLQEVFGAVQAIVHCPVGACAALPTLGRPEYTFEDAPITPDALISAIQGQEPRAHEVGSAIAALNDPNTGEWVIDLDTSAPHLSSGTGPSTPFPPTVH